MPRINEKNAERIINSYFDNPHTVHLGLGCLGVVAFWVVGQMDVAFTSPPKWIYGAVFFGVSGFFYGVDMCLTTIAEWLKTKTA